MQRTAFVILAAVLSTSGGTRAEQAASTVAPDRVAAVDRLFQRWENTESPGCTVGVARNGVTLLERAYGMADLEQERPNSTDTIIEAGSVSKQFTAMAVLLLAQEGKLSLDDPIRKYIPEVPEYPQAITIRQMLSHTSGLRDWGAVAAVGGMPRWTRVYNHAHVLDIVARQTALNFTPGSEYSYCNTGFNLAAILVARVSGQSFAEFSRTRIFEPLGMHHTSWRDDYARVMKRRARAYQRDGRGGWREDMPFEDAHGNGGLLTTVGDLLTWNENFTKQAVGGAEVAGIMQKPSTLNDGTAIEYGKGLRISTWRGVPEVGHSGSTAGYRAHLTRFPQQGLSVAILCNAADANAGGLAHAVAEVFLGQALAPEATPAMAKLDPRVLDERAGVYRSRRTGAALRLVVRDGALREDDGPRMSAASSTLFVVGEGGARAEFETNPSTGAVTGLKMMPVNKDEHERFEKLPAVSPDADALTAYAGRYTSSDAELTLVAAVEKGGLVLKRRPDSVFALTPAWADAFTSDLGTVTFRRGAGGRIEGLSVSASRVYDMRFSRENHR